MLATTPTRLDVGVATRQPFTRAAERPLFFLCLLGFLVVLGFGVVLGFVVVLVKTAVEIVDCRHFKIRGLC